MKTIPQISEAELEVMKALWELQEATSTQIVDKLTGSSAWKPKTIHTLIARLVAKEAVKAVRLDGKSYLYSPHISEQEYKSYANQSFVQKLYNGSLQLMLASFMKEQRLSPKEIDELRKILDEER